MDQFILAIVQWLFGKLKSASPTTAAVLVIILQSLTFIIHGLTTAGVLVLSPSVQSIIDIITRVISGIGLVGAVLVGPAIKASFVASKAELHRVAELSKRKAA